MRDIYFECQSHEEMAAKIEVIKALGYRWTGQANYNSPEYFRQWKNIRFSVSEGMCGNCSNTVTYTDFTKFLREIHGKTIIPNIGVNFCATIEGDPAEVRIGCQAFEFGPLLELADEITRRGG